MKSAIVADLPRDKLTVLQGAETLKSYSFGTGVAKHWFCSNCGIQVFQNLRSEPDNMSVNMACLVDFDIWSIGPLPIHDGRDNHPCDTGRPKRYSAMQILKPVTDA